MGQAPVTYLAGRNTACDVASSSDVRQQWLKFNPHVAKPMENGQRRYGLSRTTVSNCEKIVSLPTVATRRNRRLGFYRLFKGLHGGEA